MSYRTIGPQVFIDSYMETASNVFPSETIGPLKSKFHMDPQWVGGIKVCLLYQGHMTRMAAMPIYGKNPLKMFFSRTKGPVAQGLGMQHLGHGSNKV